MSSMRLMAGIALGLGVALGAHAAGDPQRGEAKTEQFSCLGCHGTPSYTNVYPTYHVPKLGGQQPEYLVSALKAYASGARQHPTMEAQAKSMSEQDMEDLAAFLSRQSQ